MSGMDGLGVMLWGLSPKDLELQWALRGVTSTKKKKYVTTSLFLSFWAVGLETAAGL